MPAKEKSIREIIETSQQKRATPGAPIYVVDGALVARITQIDQEHQALKAKIADLEAALAQLV